MAVGSADITQLVRDVQVVNYSTAAALTLGVYDVLLVAELEVEHIWKTKWTCVKALYIISRYYGLANLFVMFAVGARFQQSIDFCHLYLRFLIIGGVLLQVCIINAIEILRLYYLYIESKIFLAVISTVTIAKIIAIYTIAFKLSHFTAAETFLGMPDLPIPGCHSKSHPTYPVTIFVIGMANQCLLFCLQLGKIHMDIYRGWKAKSFRELHPTLKIFCRSGTLWFFDVVAVSIVHAVCTHRFKGPLQNVAIPWLTLVFSMTGSRLILKLRRGSTSHHYYGSAVTSLEFRQAGTVGSDVCPLEGASATPPDTLDD